MKNKKGFLMSEALVVSTVLLTALSLLYSQFVAASIKLNETKNYNVTEINHYAALIVKFIMDNDYFATITSDSGYVNNVLSISDCSTCTNLKLFKNEIESNLGVYFIKSGAIDSANNTAINKYISFMKGNIEDNQLVVIVTKPSLSTGTLLRYGYGVIDV